VLAAVNAWAFQPHPEVWLLVGGLTAGYVYMVRRVGPQAVAAGQPIVTRKNVVCASAGIALLWFASDWPMHDVGERYLYSVHMLQHMIFAYFMPPLLLLAIPEWMARLLVGEGRTYAAMRWLTRPVVAGVLFNLVVMVTHVPVVVNHSVASGPLHYGLHTLLVLSALCMWMPLCGPLPELRMTAAGKMIYLFAQSVVPTVPAGWLTFAEGAVYKSYTKAPVRVFGLSVTYDQQLAGAIMKVGGSVFLWTIIVVLFFSRFAKNWEADNSYRRRIPDAEVVGNDEVTLTYDEVTRAFDNVPAPSEPS
jgi:putative membrane protein